MIFIYMLACRSVGGSEGFVIHDAVLMHVSFSDEHSDRTVLFAWGGGACSQYGDDSTTDAHYSNEEMCERAQRWPIYLYGSTSVYTPDGRAYKNNMTMYMSDDGEDMKAEITECLKPSGYNTMELELDSANLEINGDRGHFTANAGSVLSVDINLPLCLSER